MLGSFFGARHKAVEPLHGAIVTAARLPALYDRYEVADTFTGRFEALALVATLVLRRLGALPPPAADVAQDLVDRLFQDLDRGLRIIGIGDLSVPKKMKALAGDFYGRAAAYTAALEALPESGELERVLERNLFGGAKPESLGLFTARVRSFDVRLNSASLEDLLAGRVVSSDWLAA